MGADEALELIVESKLFLEPYKVFGPMILDGISQLDKLEKLIRDGAYSDAYKMSCSMCEQISGYRSFVPKLAENLEKIRDILKGLS